MSARVVGDVQAFQFHKGTIKTGSAPAYVAKYLNFQFHKGTIKTGTSNQFSTAISDFQFHKGTIKTERRFLCTRIC